MSVEAVVPADHVRPYSTDVCIPGQTGITVPFGRVDLFKVTELS